MSTVASTCSARCCRSAGLVLVVLGLIEGPHWGWTDPKTLIAIVGGLVVLGLFALWELHTESPMLEVRLFATRPSR